MSRKDSSAVKDYFDREAGQYSERSGGVLWRRLRDAEAAALMGLLEPRRGECILDAGCGAGYYTKKIVEAGAAATALDFSQGMVGQVKKRLGVEAIQGDLQTVSIQPKFDKILCAGALEFVPDPAKAIANMAAGLRPGGPQVLVLLLPAKTIVARLYKTYHRRHGFAVNLFTPLDIKRITHGLRIDRLRRTTFNHAVKVVRA